MKYLTFALGVLLASLFLPSTVHALLGTKNFVGDDYQYDRCTFPGIVVKSKLPASTVRINTAIVRNVMAKLDFMKDVPIEVHMSRYALEGINGFTYKLYGKKHVIIIAQETTDFAAVAGTLIHEMGHVFQQARGIDLDTYINVVYDCLTAPDSDEWEYQLSEEFAEDFKLAVADKYYAGMDVKKHTYRPYNDRFRQTYRRLI